MGVEEAAAAAQVRVENIGGIDSSSVTIPRGVAALTGRNATNRTSMLRALMGALGSDRATLKGDAEEGVVELELGGETYTRRLSRNNGTVAVDGDPYLDDTEAADLFAFLLEDNRARQVIRRGGDGLRDVIMRPVDTEAIEAEIEELRAELRELDEEHDRLDGLADRRARLAAERDRLDEEIAGVRERLAEARDRFEAADADLDESRERQSAREERMAALREARSALESVRRRIASERESIEALEAEREEVAAELEGLPADPGDELEELEAEIDRLRDHRRSLGTTVSRLQDIITFNEEMLDGDGPGVPGVVEGEDGAVTDRLVEDTAVCWTCGSEVAPDAIEEMVGRLREVHRETVEERGAVADELDELKARRDEIEDVRERRERLRERLSDIEAEIEEREATLDDLAAERREREAEIEDLEAEIEEAGGTYDEILELDREINELEVELDSLEEERAEVVAEIERIEGELDRRGEIESRQAELEAELDERRTRIERLEREAVEAFNEHMETVLDRLGYERLDRVWIERREREVREGRRKVTERVFDLHVVRSTDGGAAYEDTVEHLSESEREVTGLVFALAGYLAHDLEEEVPFMVLDSLEALDADRIAALLEYFADHTEFLVVSLLVDDARELPEEYERITDL